MAASAQPMMPPPPPPPQQHTMGAPMAPDVRPTGVTILAVIYGIIGALVILFGVILVAGGGAMTAMMGAEDGGLFAALGAILGVFMLVFGALYLLVAWGLWSRKRWAWYVAMVLAVLGILGGITSFPMGIVQLLISGLIGWYLLTIPVQRWYGLNYNVPWNKQPTA